MHNNNAGVSKNKNQDDIYDEKGQVTIERPNNSTSGKMPPNAPEKNELAPRKQKSSKNTNIINNPTSNASVVQQAAVVH